MLHAGRALPFKYSSISCIEMIMFVLYLLGLLFSVDDLMWEEKQERSGLTRSYMTLYHVV